MSRSYVIPSITSRKRAPPAISAKLIPTLASNKKARRASTPIPYDEFNDEGADPSELPDELLSAIELKRRQNVSLRFSLLFHILRFAYSYFITF